MPTFTPPTSDTVPPVLGPEDPEYAPLANRLFRHYRARPAGRNVYLLSDNTVTETDPNGRTVFWQQADGSPYVSRAFYGGHDSYIISAAEKTILDAAGYTTVA